MKIFYNFDRVDKIIEDPLSVTRSEMRNTIEDKRMERYILSELCVVDMLYSITNMRDGYYKKRMVLKGGISVRNHVPIAEHRISFDADFNPNTPDGYSYGKVSRIKRDLERYGSDKQCSTRLSVTADNAMLYFLEVMYKDALRDAGAILMEPPKIEICKTCRTHTAPAESEMSTFIDTRLLGLEPPKVLHLSLEEQVANKLHTIGAQGRQRNNLDAYDAYSMARNNAVDWKAVKKIFKGMVTKANKRPSEYVAHCRHHLDSMLRNPNKRKNLELVTFRERLDFEGMIETVKSLYGFKADRF